MAVRGEGQREPPPEVAAHEVDAPGSVRPGGPGINPGSLTAIGAVIASVTYVLLNSAYLEFYESLGIRPEDVGLDRLAILGRTFGLVLIALLMYVLVIAFIVVRWLSEDTRRRRRRRAERPERMDRALRWRFVVPAVALFVAVGLLLLVVTAATVAVGRRAESAKAGIPIGPLRVGPVLLIDVKAGAARAYWLDKDLPRPQLLDDPWLLYLGSSDRVAVFMACGTTVIVPADKVIPEVLTTRDSRMALRGDAAQRKAVCATLKP